MKRLQLWPMSARVMLEFDSAPPFDCRSWWWPYFHCWSRDSAHGLRIGVLGLHLIASLLFYDDELDE